MAGIAEHLSLIYDSVSEVIFLLAVEPNDRFRFMSVNRAFLDVTGSSREQVVGKRIEEVLPETVHALVISKYKEAISENKTIFWEEISTCPTGERVGAVAVTPVRNADGVCTHLAGTVHDLTERKQMEETLRESEEKVRTLYDSSSDAIMLLDENGFFDCNDATLQLFGCASQEEFCSRHPADLSPPTQPDGTDSLSYTRNNIAVALKEGSKRFEHLHHRLDGTEFLAEVLLDAMVLGGKKVLQARVFDITERKQAEKARECLLDELEKKNADLELMNEVFVGREVRMAELKKQIAELENDVGPEKKTGDRTS